jgi:hypothetical protein
MQKLVEILQGIAVMIIVFGSTIAESIADWILM